MLVCVVTPARALLRSDRTSRVADLALLAALLGLSAFLLLVLLDFGFGRDQATFTVVGDAILHGGSPYRDAFDIKPPAVYFVYALAGWLFGPGMMGIRVLEAMGLASVFVAFGVLSRRHVGDARAGIVGAAVAVLAHVQLEFWNTAQAETFGGIAVAWALVCADPSPRRPRLVWTGAGALYTLAALLKPPLGGGFAVSLVWLASRRARTGAGAPLAPLPGFAAGAGAVLAIAVLFLTLHDAWPALGEALFGFVPAYVQVGFVWSDLPGHLLRTLGEALLGYSLYVPLGLALLFALPRMQAGERGAAAHVLAVVLLQLVGVAAQAKFFPYHFDASVLLLSLLAGWGWWKLWRRLHRHALAIVLLLLLLWPLHDLHRRHPTRGRMGFWERAWLRLDTPEGEDRHKRERLERATTVSLEGIYRVADRLREQTAADDRVFVWGFEPLIYTESGRRPASRYVHNIPQRLAWPGRDAARRELVEELAASPPAAVVVVHRDRLPRLTGDGRDSAAALAELPALVAWLEAGYRRDPSVPDFTLYWRSDRWKAPVARTRAASSAPRVER